MHEIGSVLPVWSVIPFVGMLLSIAIFPLVKSEWWEKYQLHVAIFWSLLFLVPFGIAFGAGQLTFSILEAVVVDYIPFIVLLFGLFVTTGGIAVHGTIIGTTKVNVILLLIGTLLASWIGTTGAAMLMIRPIIRANKWRKHKAHIIIFFIFMVANLGGSLTPIGDPPLFLGFLRGVPFFWTMNLLPLMLFNAAILTILFIIIDKKFYNKELAEGRLPEDAEDVNARMPIYLEGWHNFIFVAMIVAAVVLNGVIPQMDMFKDASGQVIGIEIFEGIHLGINYFVQIVVILIAAFLSWKTTKKNTRFVNQFTFGPIAEVAKLFIGIFLTMIPALALLKTHGASLGLSEPWQFFWASGLLSSFLDNAPTYLVFATTAGSLGATEGIATTIGVIPEMLLLAVSAGSVFMGANTYIGNAPNFMVKSVAEENDIKMPSFFGYMAWSGAILIPIFILDTFIFFIMHWGLFI